MKDKDKIRQEINKHLFPASEYEQDALLEWDQAADKLADRILAIQEEEAKERCQKAMQHYTETHYVGEGKRLIEAFEIAAGLEPPTK